MVYQGLSALIGNTPLYAPKSFTKSENCTAELLCKLECFNPAGSAKDRVALYMLDAALREGKLSPGGTVIEPTSGNTGIGLAAVGISRGYRVILTMPDSMSAERRALLSAFGAEIVLTPGCDGMRGAIARAEELAAQIPGAYIPSQFDNPANVLAHYETTGPELWRDAAGQLDIFVAGVGTGGTLSGVGKYLKEQNSAIRIVAVQPSASPVLTGGKAGTHGLQGIGANFIPGNFYAAICDEVLSVSEDEAYRAARTFAGAEGILVGISSGAALHAALMLSKRPENANARIAVLLPDGGERYLSTPLYQKGI